jgi:ribosome assembly protein YihI (activator of Der GTPase)
MPRNLKQATQDRAGKKTGLRKSSTPAKKAAKNVAGKAPKESSKQKIPLIPIGSNNAISRGSSTRRGAVTEAKIPGLPVLVPEQISAQLPTWSPEAYKIQIH